MFPLDAALVGRLNPAASRSSGAQGAEGKSAAFGKPA